MDDELSSDLTFGQLPSEGGELLGVPEELHHILQLILGLIHALDVLKGHVLHLHRVHSRVEA